MRRWLPLLRFYSLAFSSLYNTSFNNLYRRRCKFPYKISQRRRRRRRESSVVEKVFSFRWKRIALRFDYSFIWSREILFNQIQVNSSFVATIEFLNLLFDWEKVKEYCPFCSMDCCVSEIEEINLCFIPCFVRENMTPMHFTCFFFVPLLRLLMHSQSYLCLRVVLVTILWFLMLYLFVCLFTCTEIDTRLSFLCVMKQKDG